MQFNSLGDSTSVGKQIINSNIDITEQLNKTAAVNDSWARDDATHGELVQQVQRQLGTKQKTKAQERATATAHPEQAAQPEP